MGPILRPLRLEILNLANMQQADIFLDCCCGAGGLLQLYFNNLPQGQGMGFDLSLAMLHEAKNNSPRAQLFCADATCIPLADKSIDIASVCMALHAMPMPMASACLQELKRVAKHVFIADYCLAERNLYFPAQYLAHGVEYLVGGEHYKCYKNFMSIGALEGFLKHMGYEVGIRRHVLGGAGLIAGLKA